MFYTLRSETAGSVWYEEKNKGFCQELKLTREIYPLPIKSKNVYQKKIVLLLRQGRKEQRKVIQVKKVLIFITTQLKSSTVSQ